MKTTTPIRFFSAHAGYSYDPAKETKTQGRWRCARRLALAERHAQNVGLSFHWFIDPDSTSAEWSDERPAWRQWCCQATDQKDNVVASLSAIDFGRKGTPYGDPYKRVVEAELALEVLPQPFALPATPNPPTHMKTISLRE
jgi:hypothetical protein